MVQRLIPASGSSDGYLQIILDLALPGKVIQTPWPQAGVKWLILVVGFTRYNTSYFNLAPS